ncbi:MAG: chorismate-binding protein [Flavobacteriales bacterium]
MVQAGATLRTHRPGQRAFLIAPFEADPRDRFAIMPDLEFELDEDIPPLPDRPTLPERAYRPGLDRSGYADAVAAAVQHIRSGDLEKVVLARTIPHPLPTDLVGALFAHAVQALPDAFVALVRTREHGTWLGASPERLLRMRNGRVEVDAIAGTMPAAEVPEAPRWGIKERDEQHVVTEMVMRTLTDAGVKDLAVHGPKVLRAGPVAHLHSIVSGNCAGADHLSIAAGLHPTPAVGGAPRSVAASLITRLEPRPRGAYAGYWGLVDSDAMDLYVNIRCMELFNGHALLHVGAGITEGSDPEHECEEVERKAHTWTSLIARLGSAG